MKNMVAKLENLMEKYSGDLAKFEKSNGKNRLQKFNDG